MNENNVEQKTVCIFCGSRKGDNPSYVAEAQKMGLGLVERNWRLIYGAGGVGIMGALAETVQQHNGQVIGVIPMHLREAEAGKRDLTLSITTENMHERKKVMFVNSDALVVLPGGAGSLDEFFEVLTWSQLDLHKKPIVVVNVDGFWDPLVGLIDHVIEKGFASPSLKDLFVVASSADTALSYLEERLA